jgi:hypothetical protein
MIDFLINEYYRICEKAYQDHPDTDFDTREFDEILMQCQKEWAKLHLSEVKGTVRDFLNTLDFLEIIKVYESFCKGDFDIPLAVLESMSRFDLQASEYLASHAFEMMERKGNPDVHLSIQAAKALGRLKRTEYIPSLISYIEKLPPEEDLFIESATEGLLEMGQPAVMPMTECINKAEEINNNMEYMLQALSQLGKVEKNPEVFNCLKSAFLRMKNKDIGALCIAEFNDRRGIAFLFGYLNRHKAELSRETYYEILHCIKALGGQVDLF